MFDDGEDITPYLDLSKARRPNQEPRRVNVDFPVWMVKALDQESRRLGITRQALTKVWIAERLERTTQGVCLIESSRRHTGQVSARTVYWLPRTLCWAAGPISSASSHRGHRGGSLDALTISRICVASSREKTVGVSSECILSGLPFMI